MLYQVFAGCRLILSTTDSEYARAILNFSSKFEATPSMTVTP